MHIVPRLFTRCSPFLPQSEVSSLHRTGRDVRVWIGGCVSSPLAGRTGAGGVERGGVCRFAPYLRPTPTSRPHLTVPISVVVGVTSSRRPGCAVARP